MPAREVRLLCARDCRRVPWKNGRGTTCELALSPDGASFERADFDWRISTARIETPGPFSQFAGFDRIVVITEGSGVLLEHGAKAPRARLRKLEPYRFSGDWPTSCELVAGAVADFNVLLRRGKVDAEVMAVQIGARQMRETIGASHALLHALGGALTARVSGEEEPFELSAGDSLSVGGVAPHDELDIVGKSERSTLVLVRLDAAV
jgi:environmental stress-induced protein Ves